MSGPSMRADRRKRLTPVLHALAPPPEEQTAGLSETTA